MRLAVEEAFCGMRKNEGGPFGAVIVLKGKVIARGHNEVLKTKDPTAHAEIVALRRASRRLGRFDLSDCEIYSSCEPCPMCFSAIHWAKMEKLYYGCTRDDAAEIGFDDRFIYDVLRGEAKKTQVESRAIDRDECMKPFFEWTQKRDRKSY